MEVDAKEDLEIQLKAFRDAQEEDMEEMSSQYDTLRVSFDDLQECFDILKHSLMDTPSEPYFLSILQHLMFITDHGEVK